MRDDEQDCLLAGIDNLEEIERLLEDAEEPDGPSLVPPLSLPRSRARRCHRSDRCHHPLQRW